MKREGDGKRHKIDCINFLEGIIQKETQVYSDVFLNIHSPAFKFKKNTLLYVFRLVSCEALINSLKTQSNFKGAWYLSDGLGAYIYEARRKGISDKIIYDRIIKSRNEFLSKKKLLGASYNEIVNRRKCCEVYLAVQKSLINLCNQNIGMVDFKEIKNYNK